MRNVVLPVIVLLLLAACARPGVPDDLSLRGIRIVEAREHPIYARWTKAPPLTQLVQIDFGSASDFVYYASAEDLPFVRSELATCERPGRGEAPLAPFAGHVYWADYAVDGHWNDDPAVSELRAYQEKGAPYFYRSFLEIAANDDPTADPARPAYDLLKRPAGLCLRVSFTDMRSSPARTNLIYIPRDMVTAAFLAGDLKPGTDYPGPRLP